MAAELWWKLEKIPRKLTFRLNISSCILLAALHFIVLGFGYSYSERFWWLGLWFFKEICMVFNHFIMCRPLQDIIPGSQIAVINTIKRAGETALDSFSGKKLSESCVWNRVYFRLRQRPCGRHWRYLRKTTVWKSSELNPGHCFQTSPVLEHKWFAVGF